MKTMANLKEIELLAAAVKELPEEYRNEYSELMIFEGRLMVANKDLHPMVFADRGVWRELATSK